ncbi:DUF805 domain-containing protein [Mesorhizobium sp. ES1-4]|uniref:DUF805 domain-containing protein n=1 Tax=Mesorhizobium sp. ES1-4 TaxID=2876627 RepID=UPI001CCF1577|nr:DUF805 domain-containing protein [Mesorhizobium sp. ES1-4]MBZ9796961.1 DUF805 domain-containing protein [Mesorhizobium sp. ES1-4]
MQGEVLHYDEDQGFGFIAGADGNRYTFTRESLRRETAILKGMAVEFRPGGGQARDVFSIAAHAAGAVAARAATPAGTMTAAIAPAIASASAAVPIAPRQHFGRPTDARSSDATGLWSYFQRAVTENYLNFTGRARRKEYWGYCLFWFIALLVVAGIGVLTDVEMGHFDDAAVPAVTIGLLSLYLLATFLPGLGMTVRRLHDIGLSGWLYLLILIPSIGGLIILVFALIPTQGRENQWGPVPAGIRI